MVAITVYLRDNLVSFCIKQAEKQNISINDFIKKLIIVEFIKEKKHE